MPIVYTVVATFVERTAARPVVAVASTHYEAVQIVNTKLARLGMWNYLPLPEGDDSVIRNTAQGNIKFTMENHAI